jgi:hypothetical protein
MNIKDSKDIKKNAYLKEIYLEAERRGYNFNPLKIGRCTLLKSISVTRV